MTVTTMQRPDAGVELRSIYERDYASLVRLASLLVDDRAVCEELVQDAFVRTLVAWPNLRDPSKAPQFLRSAVLNGARSRLRHLGIVRRHPTAPPPTAPGHDTAVVERRQMIEELRRLPHRQREALVLRFYLDLSEADIAQTMGVSTGSVKTHLHRGLATLGSRLEEQR